MPAIKGDTTVSPDQAEDDRLREAFQTLGRTSVDECSEENLDRVWRAVSGELPADERRDLVELMARAPAVAEAWRAAHALRVEPRGTVDSNVVRRMEWRQPWWLAAAAVLLLSVGIGLVYQRDRPSGDEFRAPAGYTVESLVAEDASLPRDAVRLRWTPAPPGARYQVRVTTEDLRVLTTATDLTVPELLVPSDVLASVATGSRVLWQVEVTLPEGATVSSNTFVTRVQ